MLDMVNIGTMMVTMMVRCRKPPTPESQTEEASLLPTRELFDEHQLGWREDQSPPTHLRTLVASSFWLQLNIPKYSAFFHPLCLTRPPKNLSNDKQQEQMMTFQIHITLKVFHSMVINFNISRSSWVIPSRKLFVSNSKKSQSTNTQVQLADALLVTCHQLQKKNSINF